MLSSMTGYGKASVRREGVNVNVEIRSLNHRYLDVAVRGPRQVIPLEEGIRKTIAREIHRGRIDVFIDVTYYGEMALGQVKVDKGLCLAYYNALRDLQAELGLAGGISISDMVNLPGIFSNDQIESSQILESNVLETVQKALDEVLSMRRAEGGNITKEIRQMIDKSYGLIIEIERKSISSVGDYRDRLTKRIKDLIGTADVDENRLAQEIVVFSERTNITEEIQRLHSHLAVMARALEEGGPVGRKMDFVTQEMGREINTIGSKTTDEQISKMVVIMKTCVDSLREQIQNIE